MPRTSRAAAKPADQPTRRKSYLGLKVASALAAVLQKPDKYNGETMQSVVHFNTLGEDLHIFTFESTGGDFVVPVFRAPREALAGAPETFAVRGSAFKAALATAKAMDFSGIEFAWDQSLDAMVIEASDGCYRYVLPAVAVKPLQIKDHLTILGEILAQEVDGATPIALTGKSLERLSSIAKKSAVYDVGAVSVFSMPGKPYGVALFGATPGLAVLLSVASPAPVAPATRELLEAPLHDGLIARANQARMYRERAAAIADDNPELAAALLRQAEQREQWLERQCKLFGLPALPAPTVAMAPEPPPEAEVDATDDEEDAEKVVELRATRPRARKARQRRLH